MNLINYKSANKLKIRSKLIIVLVFIYISYYEIFAQNSEMKVYTGVFLEYNTLILTHNLKLFTDLNYYKNEKVVLSLQPGVEFIYGLPNETKRIYSHSPYYDINLLGAIQLFPNYGISIKPFVGLSYRISTQDYETDFTSLEIKYGTTLQLNTTEEFMIIGKIMNIPTSHPDDVSILLGVGFSFKLF